MFNGRYTSYSYVSRKLKVSRKFHGNTVVKFYSSNSTKKVIQNDEDKSGKKRSSNSEDDSKRRSLTDEYPQTLEKYVERVQNSVSSPRRALLVPKVASTDNLSKDEIQTEGLFAGYRPLFLGNSSLKGDTKTNILDNFFSSFANLRVSEAGDDSSQSGKMQNVLDNLQKDMDVDSPQYSEIVEGRKPIIPWDASISGMVYSDRAFKDLPKKVVSKLKPFKMVKIEKSQQKSLLKAKSLIKMKVHNSKVSDDLEMVNLFETDRTKHYDKHIQNGSIIGVSRDQMIKFRKEYETEMNNYLILFKFLKSDQRLYDTYISKLNRFLSKQILRQTNLRISSPLLSHQLPLFIYLPPTGMRINSLRRILRKQVMSLSSPLITTLLSVYQKDSQKEKFLKKFNTKLNRLLSDLIISLPSYHIRDNESDCIIQQSPVPNFKRIYWLKPTIRRNTFYGKNIDQEYFFNYSKDYDVTRSNIKYMKYPINLDSKTFKEAFGEGALYE